MPNGLKSRAQLKAAEYARRPLIEGRLVTFYLPDIYWRHVVAAALVAAAGLFLVIQPWQPSEASSRARAAARLELLPAFAKGSVAVDAQLAEMEKAMASASAEAGALAQTERPSDDRVASLGGTHRQMVSQLDAVRTELASLEGVETAVRERHRLGSPLWETSELDFISNSYFRLDLMLEKVDELGNAVAAAKQRQEALAAREAEAALAAARAAEAASRRVASAGETRRPVDSGRRRTSNRPSWRADRF